MTNSNTAGEGTRTATSSSATMQDCLMLVGRERTRLARAPNFHGHGQLTGTRGAIEPLSPGSFSASLALPSSRDDTTATSTTSFPKTCNASPHGRPPSPATVDQRPIQKQRFSRPRFLVPLSLSLHPSALTTLLSSRLSLVDLGTPHSFSLVCCTSSTMRRYASLGPLASLAWLASAAVVPRK